VLSSVSVLSQRHGHKNAVKEVMNKLTSVDLKDNSRPSWVYLSQAGTMNKKVSLGELLKMDKDYLAGTLGAVAE